MQRGVKATAHGPSENRPFKGPSNADKVDDHRNRGISKRPVCMRVITHDVSVSRALTRLRGSVSSRCTLL